MPAAWVAAPLPVRTSIRRHPAARAAPRSSSRSPIIAASAASTRNFRNISTSIPGFGGRQSAKIWVPLDDEHTMVWETNWSMGEELSPERQQGWEGRIPPSGFKPDTTEWLGRARFWADETNDFYIDRERQKNENFTGFEESNPIQDGGIQVTMGKIFDRTKEHLGTTDATIVQVRKKLVQSAKAYQEHGIVPPGVDEPAAYRLHGAEFTLEREGDWTEYSKDLVRKMS